MTDMDKRCALIVIDMQNGFINPASAQCIAGAQATVPACAAVIDACRKRGIPVFFVTRVYRADGSDVEHTRYFSWLKGGKAMSPGCPAPISADMPEEFGFCARDYHLIKPRFSAFFHTELDLMLRRLGIDTVILTGTTTPNCIRTTCYDALSLEYNVTILEDCTSSVTPEIQAANILDMENIGAQILSSEAFLSGAPIEDSLSAVHKRVRA